MINDIESALLDIMPYMVVVLLGGIIAFKVLLDFSKEVEFTHRLDKPGQFLLELSNKQILGVAIIVSRFVFVCAQLWIGVATNMSIMFALAFLVAALAICLKSVNYCAIDIIFSIVVMAIIVVNNTLNGYIASGVLVGADLSLIHYLQMILGTLFSTLVAFLGLSAVYKLEEEVLTTGGEGEKRLFDAKRKFSLKGRKNKYGHIKSKVKATLEPKVEIKLKTESETEIKPEPKAEVKPEPDMQADTKPEPKPEAMGNQKKYHRPKFETQKGKKQKKRSSNK